MNESYSQINDTLPLELISRTMAYQVNNGVYNCERFFYNVNTGSQQAQDICNSFDMKNPEQVKFYINATWYGSPDTNNTYATKFMDYT